MPGFEVQWTRGVQVLPYEDPDKGTELPGRLNPRQNLQPLHSVCRPGKLVQLSAVVDGVVGPYANNHFLCQIIEYPGTIRPKLFHGWFHSSVQSFVARARGHYTVMMIGIGTAKGRVIAHLSCEDP